MRATGKISIGLTAAMLLANAAQGQTAPSDENGRYTLSATDNGYLRLDTRTGAVSICTGKGGWVCRVVPDERAALDQEIGRLMKENQSLKDRLAQRGDTANPPQAGGDAASKPAPTDADKDATIELRIPSQNKLAAALDRVWQHLVDIAVRVQKKLSENI